MKAIFLRVPRWMELATVFAGCYLCADALVWGIRVVTHWNLAEADLRPLLLSMHLLVLCGAALVPRFVRASIGHPVSQSGYRNWLRTTPWQPGMPLPLGPAALVWSDGLVLLVLTALAHWHLHVTILLPILCFCCGFAVGGLPALAKTFGWGAYIDALGLAVVVKASGLALILVSVPMLYFATAVAAALAAWTQFAIHRSLRGFPWETDPSTQAPETPGWLSMIPRDCAPLVSSRAAIATCVFIAVWTWVLLSFHDGQFSRENAMVAVISVAAIGAFIRFARYYGAYMPPMSILRRLVTGRLVIPGYDYAILAPAASLLVAGALSFGLGWLRVPPSVIVACSVGVVLAVLLMAPPTFRTWQLTGLHRRIPFARPQRTAPPLAIQ